jgi:glycogen(starch) synthase
MGNDVHVVARRVSSSQPTLEHLSGVTIHRLQRGIFFSSSKSSFVDVNARGSYRGDTSPLLWRSYELYLKTMFPVYVALEVVKIVREFSIDVVFERETSFGAGAIASIITNRPLVLEVIGNRVTGLQLKRATKIVAYTRGLFEGQVEDSKVEIVTGAVDTDLFKPDEGAGLKVRKDYSLGHGPVIGYVGTFQEWHGISELIEAAKGVVAKSPDARFLMVGPYYKETQSRVAFSGLGSSFVFTGPVAYELVPNFINACDVLVAPYNPNKIRSSEQVRKHGLGSPLKVFEYMAVGKPAVTTDVRPISDPVEDRVTGFLVPPGDAEALELTIMRIINDKAEAKAVGQAARRSVLEHFSWGVVANQLEGILESAMTPPRLKVQA